MDDISTNELTPEETVQFQTMLDETVAEMKRIRKKMSRDDFEIARSKARIKSGMAEIKIRNSLFRLPPFCNYLLNDGRGAG